ncbi:MFS transporter [Paraburkholderia diazotrophica]|uniref:Sugar phosphate permease n=1 Tax=Paraburkholderia diazotrophica TaxID=667676 RepID=A0A1H6VS96_9BURK|nr:MFS transporter [Paraburkholderia diazotrophica]SEJ02895.1 Sugar phosphate permease [Paraburkholderia diazotrophica]
MRNPAVETNSPTERILILVAVCLAGLSMPVSFTGPAIALPAIARALDGSPLALNWVTNAFMLGFGSCLLVAGTCADLFGRKRVFLCGTLGFALSSIVATRASSMLALDLLRALQGVASATALSAGAAALAQEFEGEARTRAFSVLGTTFGVGLAFGPIVAGALIANFGWRSVFWSVTVITLTALCVGAKCIRETRDPGATGLDLPGAATFTCGLTLFTYAVLRVPDSRWTSPLVLGLLAASAVVTAIFVLVETRVRRPMLDLSLFRYPRFIGVQFLAAAPAYSYVVLLVLLPVRFIGIEGYSSVAAGQMMFALSAPMLVIPMLAGYLTRWFTAGVISGAGLLLCACGQFWLAQCEQGQPIAHMLMAMFLIGVGVSFPWGLMDGLAVSVVPKERAGMATGIFNTTRVAGEGIALAIVSALLASFVETKLRGTAFASVDARILAEAASRLVMGDLSTAVTMLAHATTADLVKLYGAAFRLLLYVLAGITVLSAVMVFGFLSHSKLPHLQEQEPDVEPASRQSRTGAAVQ